MSELIAFYKFKGWGDDLILFDLMGCWFDDSPVVGGLREPKGIFIVNNGINFVITQEFITTCKGK